MAKKYWFMQCANLSYIFPTYKKKQNPKNKVILQFKIWIKQDKQTLSDDDFEIKSKIYSLNCLSCFIHILNCKMTLFFGFCFFLYFLKLPAGRGLFPTYSSFKLNTFDTSTPDCRGHYCYCSSLLCMYRCAMACNISLKTLKTYLLCNKALCSYLSNMHALHKVYIRSPG